MTTMQCDYTSDKKTQGTEPSIKCTYHTPSQITAIPPLQFWWSNKYMKENNLNKREQLGIWLLLWIIKIVKPEWQHNYKLELEKVQALLENNNVSN